MKRFKKSFTQQEEIPQAGIDAAIEILNSGRLHRYNTPPDGISEAALLEEDYAAYPANKVLSGSGLRRAGNSDRVTRGRD